MIRLYFAKSWHLTRSNYAAFIEGTIFLIVGSILTLGLMLPTLVTGLEGMYLKAWRGEPFNGKDVFMYRRKFFPLLGTALLISLDVAMFMLVVIFVFVGFFFLGELIPRFFFSPSFFFLHLILMVVFVLFIFWREGKHLHALNLVAERNIGIWGALRQSRKTTRHPFTSAFLVFLYSIVLGLIGLPRLDTIGGDRFSSQPNIKSIDLHEGGFDINWYRSHKSDFRSYELEKSTSKNMNNFEVVFTSTNVGSTFYRDENVEPGTHMYYYRIAITTVRLK